MAAMLLASVRMFGSVPRRSRPQWSVVRPRISVFEFRISKLKIQFLNLEFQVPCPDMRVSVCAYPGAGAGEGDPAAPRAPVLTGGFKPPVTGGFSVWLALAYGVCSVAFCSLAPGAQRRRRHSGAMADSARAVRTGREREEEGADGLARRNFAVDTSAQPQSRLAVSSRRGSARRQRISRRVCRKFWPKRLGHGPPQWTRPSVPHWLQSGPKPLRARRQWAWAPHFGL